MRIFGIPEEFRLSFSAMDSFWHLFTFLLPNSRVASIIISLFISQMSEFLHYITFLLRVRIIAAYKLFWCLPKGFLFITALSASFKRSFYVNRSPAINILIVLNLFGFVSPRMTLLHSNWLATLDYLSCNKLKGWPNPFLKREGISERKSKTHSRIKCNRKYPVWYYSSTTDVNKKKSTGTLCVAVNIFCTQKSQVNAKQTRLETLHHVYLLLSLMLQRKLDAFLTLTRILFSMHFFKTVRGPLVISEIWVYRFLEGLISLTETKTTRQVLVSLLRQNTAILFLKWKRNFLFCERSNDNISPDIEKVGLLPLKASAAIKRNEKVMKPPFDNERREPWWLSSCQINFNVTQILVITKKQGRWPRPLLNSLNLLPRIRMAKMTFWKRWQRPSSCGIEKRSKAPRCKVGAPVAFPNALPLIPKI